MKVHLIWAVILLPCTAFCQQESASPPPLNALPPATLNQLSSKAQTLDNQLSRETAQYLDGFAKTEKGLASKLVKIDSGSKNLFAYSGAQYASLTSRMRSDSASGAAILHGPYLAHADSIRVGLSFLQQHPELLGASSNLQSRLPAVSAQWQQLQTKVAFAEQARQYIRQRQAQIGQYLSRFSSLPSAISKSYQQYGQRLYYYSQTVSQYKTMLNDPGQLQQKALAILNKLPAFQQFMQKNSQLAQLFGATSTGTAQAIAGLQTKANVQQLIQSKIAGGGPQVQGSMAGKLDIAGQGLATLQNRIAKYGDAGQDMEAPDFKPNGQKTKSFLNRLEYGVSLQTQPSTTFYPTTSNLGLTIGYRLSDNNTVGVGASALIGWGTDISHINVTGSGLGLRSFADIQLKKSFYISGGMEYNYQPVFSSLRELPGIRSWTQSGLVGVSKIVSVKSQVLKKTNLQLLWDFLSYEQVPRTPAFKFRVGYGF